MTPGPRRKDNVRFLHNADYQFLFEKNPSGIYLASMPFGILENCNESFARLLGFESPTGLLGQKLSQFFMDLPSYETFQKRLLTEPNLRGDQQCIRRRDGALFWIMQDIRLFPDPRTNDLNILGTVIDITTQKEKEEKFLKGAFYDSLTGLPNRSLFLDRLGLSYDRARRNPDYGFAVLFLDLDRFKWINDSFGHKVGDDLLVAAAKRLNSKIRGGDTVARLGGDEFAVLLGDVRETADATRAAARIQSAFQSPFRLAERELFITVSIGIATSSGQWFCNQEGSSQVSLMPEPLRNSIDRPENLLWEADAVLYRAKQLGRARYEVFDAAMHKKVTSLAQLEHDLRKAVEEDQLVNHYQPIISLQTGKIIGFESCLRWHHPVQGLLESSEFALLAEQMGLHGTIDRLFVRKACIHLMELEKSFPQNEQLFISANLSISVFRDPDFVKFVAGLLKSFPVGRERLWFEISESALMEYFEGIRNSVDELRSLGITIVLDDFGTGFSSLKALPQFPADVLKVDSSLIKGMAVNEMSVDIVGTLIALGHSLGFSIFADGVETSHQIAELRRLGCEGVQGKYFSAPVESAVTLELLAVDKP